MSLLKMYMYVEKYNLETTLTHCEAQWCIYASLTYAIMPSLVQIGLSPIRHHAVIIWTNAVNCTTGNQNANIFIQKYN